ncbi:MAG TPA: hypothetical protein VK194_01020, partial [Candidatus Deferrimicrobium sp.]|nr:hypothetical protein [Candidatus Deferrimicrobium sp.]
MVTTVDRPTFERLAGPDDEFRGPAGVVRFLEIPPRRVVMIDGSGPPGPEAFAPRLPGLYTTAYKLRFGLKARDVLGKVRPLEGLWWTADGSTDLDAIFGGGQGREDWRWSLFIALPEEATEAEIADAVEAGRAKLEPPYAASLRVETFDEGRVAQLLHVGPYAAERASIERLHQAATAAGLRFRGPHHEI